MKTEPRFTIALVAAHDGDQIIDESVISLGSALSRGEAVEVLVCPWDAVHLADGAVQITGPMIRCVAGNRAPFIADHVQPGAMLSFPTADHTAPDRSPRGRAALARLARQGLALPPCALTTTAVIAALLEEAAHRGIVSNAMDHDAAWGRKDQLEFTLRAHARFTDEPVPRPETYVVSPHQLPVILADFARRGLTCIVKPANGARGDGLHIVRPHRDDSLPVINDGGGDGGDDCFVVQELVEAPLTLQGRKVDFRCYLLIDTADPHASRWCPPLFARIAGLPYARGVADAEITNCAYRARAGLAEGMFPLEHLDGLPATTRAALLAGVDALMDAVIAARFLRAQALAPAGEPRRVLLWGLDLIATDVNGEIAVQLLEINVYPHLLIGSDTCDPAMECILGQTYARLLRHQCTEGAA